MKPATCGISFILPTYNEEKYIARCIETILNEGSESNYPYEIIVVDNLSNDLTIAIAAKYNISILKCLVPGSPSATRNLGAANAKFSILCFIDGDCLISKGWFDRIFSTFEDKQVAAYGGPILSPKEGNWIERAWAPTISADFRLTNAALAGGNFSVRRNIFMHLRGFDEKLITAEDDEFSRRISRSGYCVINDSEHPVIHLGYPKSLLEIYRKQLWHASSQLAAHGLTGDKLVMLTIAWIAALIFAIPVTSVHVSMGAILIITALLLPAALTVKRALRFRSRDTFLLFKIYLICWPVLLGRAVGLIREILASKWAATSKNH